jgi:hypothetical protein
LYEQAIELDPPEDGKPVYPDHFMLKFPSWALYKDWEKFPGCPPPQVFPPEEDPQLARDEQRDPDTFKVEYRAQFAEVENAFLRSEMVERMFDPAFNESRSWDMSLVLLTVLWLTRATRLTPTRHPLALLTSVSQ